MDVSGSSSSSSSLSAAPEGICVAIRMRPMNEREITGGQEQIFKSIPGYNAVAQMHHGQPVEGQTFYYDKVFDESSSTNDVYQYVASELLQKAMYQVLTALSLLMDKLHLARLTL